MEQDAVSKSAAEAVWELTCSVYATEAVADACIGLQDRHGIGVSALLALLAMAALGYPVAETARLEAVLARAERWQRAIIEPLRALRRRIPAAASADIEADAAALREHLIGREVEAERLQQALLVADSLASRSTPAPAPAVGRAPGAAEPDAIERAARAYLGRYRSAWHERDEAALQVVLRAFRR